MKLVHQVIHVHEQVVEMPEQPWWPCWVSPPEPAVTDILWSLDRQSRASQMVPPVGTVRRLGAFLRGQATSTVRWSMEAGHYAGTDIGTTTAVRHDNLRLKAVGLVHVAHMRVILSSPEMAYTSFIFLF